MSEEQIDTLRLLKEKMPENTLRSGRAVQGLRRLDKDAHPVRAVPNPSFPYRKSPSFSSEPVGDFPPAARPEAGEARQKNRRDGKIIYYSLADDHVYTIFNQGLSHILE